MKPIKAPAKIPAIAKPILSLRDLEFRLGEGRETLRLLAEEWRNEYLPFQKAKKPKPFQREAKSGKLRDIDNPSKELKRIQTKILNRLLLPVSLPNFLFGAVPKRSIKDHAEAHLGSGCVVKMDVKSYYPNVTSRHVYYVWCNVLGCSPSVAGLLTQLTTYEWHLPQGSPTSPALANLYLASIYSPVLESCSELGVTATAWVDDLIFSGENARAVMELVRTTLASNGFKLSRKKREILSGRDPKVITGVRLGADRLRAPKNKIADIRAGIHKLKVGKVAKNRVEKYVTSLKGRIDHVSQICASDASRLKQYLGNLL